MSLQELKEQAFKLSVSDRLALISALIESLQTASQTEDWKYLVTRPHPWRRQLYIKGRKLLVSTVWPEGVTSVRQTRHSKPFSPITFKKIVWLLCNKTGTFNQSMG